LENTEKMERAGQAPGLSREDIAAAMRSVPGYLDISLDDFAVVYRAAYVHALQRLRQGVTAGKIMTRQAAWAAPDTPLAQVAAEMARLGVSGLPVVDADKRVVGVISERDILKAMRPEGEGGFMGLVAACLAKPECLAAPLRKQTAGSLMSAPPVTVVPEADAEAMARLMADKVVNRLPVVDGQGRLVGIVTRGDLVAALNTRGAA
jgi:CBS domain-containing membrane protein